MTPDDAQKIRAQAFNECAAEVLALSDAANGDGSPLFSDAGRRAVRVVARYIESWATDPDPLPAWREQHSAG